VTPRRIGATDATGPQVPSFATNCPDGPYGGCVYMDMTELEVFGVPTTP
jgi:hypothetical protein